MHNLIGIGVFLLLLMNFVSAFGVSSPYWDGNPVYIAKGETKIINFNVQNMVGDGDVNVKAIVREGSDIAVLKEGGFIVKAGSSDKLVPLEIRIPESANVGDVKRVKVDFMNSVPGGNGMVSLGTGMSVAFDVIVTEREKASNNLLIAIVLIVIAVVLIVYLVRRMR
ncbi:MAG: hypothetical protein N3D20_02295 [Candidatus Pacearchaeota archaeon]|nr:hypothetical protein [Candidatus Pacearchaeota archaeon]